MIRRRRDSRLIFWVSRPLIVIEPFEMRVNLSRLRASEDLPAPVRPTTPMRSRGLTSKLILCSTSGPSSEYLTERSRTSRLPSVGHAAGGSLSVVNSASCSKLVYSETRSHEFISISSMLKNRTDIRIDMEKASALDMEKPIRPGVYLFWDVTAIMPATIPIIELHYKLLDRTQVRRRQLTAAIRTPIHRFSAKKASLG